MKFITINKIEYSTAVIMSKFEITYGIHLTPFGNCLIGITNTINNQIAICHLWFFNDDSTNNCIEILKNEWPDAKLNEQTNITHDIIKKIFSNNNENNESLIVLLKGSEFQICVWKALLTIPKGNTITYGDVAELIGNPKAIRPVARAIASNRIGYLVPCHRVLPKNRSISKFRWGTERRFAILNYEKKNI